MFGLGKKPGSGTIPAPASSAPSPKEAPADVDIEITTMRNDLNDPYKEDKFSVEIPKEQIPINPTEQQKNNLPGPFTTADPIKAPSALPEESLRFQSQLNSRPKDQNQRPNTTPSLEKVITEYHQPREKKAPATREVDFPSFSDPSKNPQKPNPTSTMFPNKPPMPDRPYATPASSVPKPVNPQASKISSLLLYAAVVILLITIGAGSYYYFFILNAAEPTQSEQAPSQTQTTEQTLAELPPSLKNTKTLPIENNDLLETTKSEAKQLKNGASDTESGFYQPIGANANPLKPSEINHGLKINLPEIKEMLKSGWLHLSQHPTSGMMKMSLIYEVIPDAEISSVVTRLESTLPERLKYLFLEEQPAAVEPVVFSQSEFDRRVRFFNFTANDATNSIDWGVIRIEGVDFLLFSTSRESMLDTIKELEK